MASIVLKSNTPLVADALPALKVQHYTGQPAQGNIYTFARFYFFQNGLDITLHVFEKEPSPSSRARFVFGPLQGPLLSWEAGPQTSLLTLVSGSQASPLPPLDSSFFTGQDEQGWYWGRHLFLPAESLSLLGSPLDNGQEFCAAVFKTQLNETAYGSSFQTSQPKPWLTPSQFGRFTAVYYA